MKAVLVADVDCHTGENPLWHPEEKVVYWVDIPNGRLYSYDPALDQHELVFDGPPIGGFTIQEDGSLLLFMAKGMIAIWRKGMRVYRDLELVIEEIPAERNTRFNDVIADPAGRVFCGTMPTQDRPAHLYRLDPDGTLTMVLDDVGLSNGLGFTPDRRGLYYTDTRKQKIYLFDYDEATGALINKRVFVDVPNAEGEGHPDGLTVDAEGNVWSARWDGYCVVQYNPQGEELQRIKFPVPKVSCPTFGGEAYTDMYVTTASTGNREQEAPFAGSLFRVDVGVRGVPEFRSRIKAR
ncbi:MAG: SMP-30/gluconolactonase/LRE family protein [Anaerolineae bacterium]